MNVSAAVLAGGKSSRFGSDKALYIYNKKPLMQWVLDSFVDMEDVFIVANQQYPQFKLPIYRDIVDSRGPLVGILTALEYAQHDWVAVAACDMPFLSPDYWRAMLSKRKDNQVVIVKSESGLQPLAALYHSSIKEQIRLQFEKNTFSVQEMLKTVKVAVIDVQSMDIDEKIFANFNYKDDLNLL